MPTSAQTLEGATPVTVIGSKVYVGGAHVAKADVMASNGVIHVINKSTAEAELEALRSPGAADTRARGSTTIREAITRRISSGLPTPSASEPSGADEYASCWAVP